MRTILGLVLVMISLSACVIQGEAEEELQGKLSPLGAWYADAPVDHLDCGGGQQEIEGDPRAFWFDLREVQIGGGQIGHAAFGWPNAKDAVTVARLECDHNHCVCDISTARLAGETGETNELHKGLYKFNLYAGGLITGTFREENNYVGCSFTGKLLGQFYGSADVSSREE